MATGTSHIVWRILLLYSVSTALADQATCPATSQSCECEFSGSSPDGGEADETAVAGKSEMMAAAVGALSPMLVAGTGFGVWKIIQGTKSQKYSLNRSVSSLSDSSSDTSQKSPKSNYDDDSRRGSIRTTLSLMDTDDDMSLGYEASRTGSAAELFSPDDPSPRSPRVGTPVPQTGTSTFYKASQSDNINSWMN